VKILTFLFLGFILSIALIMACSTSAKPAIEEPARQPIQSPPKQIVGTPDLTPASTQTVKTDLHGWLEWGDGFYELEGTTENNWRWCSDRGTLIINNPANEDRKITINTGFSTPRYPEFSNLKIESSLFNDNLKINNIPLKYIKEIVVPPGRNIIKFSCDAMRVNTTDPRYLVFETHNFQLVDRQ
jgi:hypothetical protein